MRMARGYRIKHKDTRGNGSDHRWQREPSSSASSLSREGSDPISRVCRFGLTRPLLDALEEQRARRVHNSRLFLFSDFDSAFLRPVAQVRDVRTVAKPVAKATAPLDEIPGVRDRYR